MSERNSRLFVAIAILIFCVIYTENTAFYPGNGDQLTYVYAAKTLSEGQGLRQLDDVPLTVWPPGYSIALALFGGGLQAARIINALGLWVTVLCGYLALRQYDAPHTVAAGVCLAFIAYSSDFETVFQSANSEALFMPLLMLWFVSLSYVNDGRVAWLNGLLAAAMGLTRYIGMPFAALGLLWIAYKRGTRGAIGPALASGGLMGSWLLRNYLIVGRLTGHAQPGAYIGNDVWKIILTVDRWIALVIVGCCLCVSLAFIWSWVAFYTSSFSISEEKQLL